MRHILILFIGLSMSGCYKTGLIDTDGRPLPDDDYPGAIKDIWEYNNADGVCPSTEYFGDAYTTFHYGCLQYAQIVRFADGTSYITLNVGTTPAMSIAYSSFVHESVTVFEHELHLGPAPGTSSDFVYSIYSDLSFKRPTLVMDFDVTGVYTDAVSRSFVLTRIAYDE